MTRLRARLALVLAERESGYVAVFVALCLPLLVGMCALAVDVASWQVEGTKAQKAADAAALAGTIYLPTSQSTAFTTATDLARINGYSAANGDTVTVARTTKPTQLRVTITTTVNNTFGVIFGRSTTRVTRTSVADYAGPIPMGSPCNVFGNEEMESSTNQVGSSECDGQAGIFWVNIAGTNTNKARGDGYESAYCTNPNPAPTIDRCTRVTGNSAPLGTPTNQDYIENKDPVTGLDVGYLYGVRVTQAGINLDIQGFDMSWVAQGDGCEMSTMNGATAASNTYVTDAPARYAKGKTAFCAGDSNMDTPEGDGNTSGGNSPSKVTTIIKVYEPSTTPWKPLDAPLICSLTLNGFDDTTVLSRALDAGSPGYIDEVARYFHRWESLCRVNGAKLGDYTVQIRTVGGGGQNRFAMRVDAGAASRQVSMFAQGKTSFYNSVPAGTSVFYLARLDSGAAGKILNVDFFDLADADDPVNVTVLRPDSNQPFTTCSKAGPPIVDSDDGTPITNCTISTTNAGNNGRWVRIKVSVPVTYTCSNDADPGVCWVRVRLDTAGGQNDTTTWRASLEGDPVRIVE